MWFDKFFYIMQMNKKFKITRQMKATTEKVLISLSFSIFFLMFLSVMIHNCDEDFKGKKNNTIWSELVAFKGCDQYQYVSSIFSFEVWQKVMTLLTDKTELPSEVLTLSWCLSSFFLFDNSWYLLEVCREIFEKRNKQFVKW